MFFAQGSTGSYVYRSISVQNLEILLDRLVKSQKMREWYQRLDPTSEIFKFTDMEGAVRFKEKCSTLDVDGLTSHLLRRYLLDGNMHPAKDFPELFSPDFPQGVLTYEWAKSLGGGEDGVLKTLKDRLSINDDPQLRFWVDILFINQLSKNIPVELAIAQEYYILCDRHVVAGSRSLLDRGWCIWELGLRAHSKKSSIIIGDLDKKARICYSCVWIWYD